MQEDSGYYFKIRVFNIMNDVSERIKAESIEMLEYFDRFCKDHNIDYSIAFGTELGAVRHKGFIPWDDDVDVDMYYIELKKFRRKWKRYGDKRTYFFQDKKTDKYISTLFPRLRKNGTTWIDPNCEDIPIHWGLPVDIFPIFNAPSSKKWQARQERMYNLAERFCRFHWSHLKANSVEKAFNYFLTLLFYRMVIFMSWVNRKSGIAYYPNGYKNRKHITMSELLPTKTIQFDRLELRGHNNSDKYLSWQYGDYMTPPPLDQREGHPVGIIDLDNDSKIYTNHLR